LERNYTTQETLPNIASFQEKTALSLLLVHVMALAQMWSKGQVEGVQS